MLLFHLHVGVICCFGDFFSLFFPESVTLQGNAALFIDGFALVAATGKLEKAKNFGGFADCYVNTMLRKGSESMCYMKATTRRRRSKNTAACAQR